MAAVLARGETVISNAASEPHVQDLCRFLVALGAQIEGIGSNVLRVQGVDRLRGGEWRICPDHIEVASFIGLGAVTEGEIVIEDVVPEHLAAIWPGFERLGVSLRDRGLDRPGARAAGARRPRRSRRADPEDRGRAVAGVSRRPDVDRARGGDARPGAPCWSSRRCSRTASSSSTSSSPWAPGSSSAILIAPSSAGPAKLYGERMESPDIRAGMAMLIASLCAEGRSTIGNIGQIDRGYERIDERLRELGARIERVDGLNRKPAAASRPAGRRRAGPERLPARAGPTRSTGAPSPLRPPRRRRREQGRPGTRPAGGGRTRTNP